MKPLMAKKFSGFRIPWPSSKYEVNTYPKYITVKPRLYWISLV